ncbi:hypothetical protein [Paraconexibacter sp.]|uniref:hypothetical protein n=1 Tax=Paraconexibacter sp. TaxID=2949640 RepID=UPI00356AA29E
MTTWMRRAALVLTGAAAVGIAGCGDEDDYANAPRPPAPIVITAAITGDGITVSPSKFGAGPISLIVSNQTETSQQVTLETSDTSSGPGLTQSTGPINPRDTATLRADVDEGTYTVSVAADAIKSATVRVGAERPSAQNELLQP